MMPTRNTENLEHHEYNQQTNNPPSSPYYNRNSRVFGAMNQAPTVIYHHPQTAFHQQSELSNDPRRYGMSVAPNNAMQGSLMQLDPAQHGMITNAPSYPMAYREHPSFPNAGNIYVTADGQRIAHMGAMPIATTAATPHYAYTGGGVDMSTQDVMQQLPPSSSTNTASTSFQSQSEREEELLLQLLIARRNRTQQTGVGANDSLADELMRLRQSRGFQTPGFPMGGGTTMNQSVMDASLGGTSMQRQYMPDLNGRIDRNPTRLVDARTQDMMDLSQRGVGKRSDPKFDHMYMGQPDEEDVAPQKKQKRAHRKKPADMPRRPLSAYNLFFSEERERILKEIESKEEGKADTESIVEKKGSEDQSEADKSETNVDDEDATAKPKAFLRPLVPTEKKRRPHRKTHGKISFQTLARMVGERWKSLSEERRKYYQDLAEEDAKRQKIAMDEYYAKQSTGTRKKNGDEVVDKEEEEEEADDVEDDAAKEKEPPLSEAVSVEKDVSD